ncbi:MAG: hypothetical protein NUW01_14095 [Gemmatimonadaceae bacterium]|nr:hypothetical protein [Gemmatimonadaceae bacterium]
MKRSTFVGTFVGSLLGLVAAPKELLAGLAWPKTWTPYRLPSETYEEWAGLLHYLLLHRKAKVEKLGGVPRYFHCNQMTAVRLGAEVSGDADFRLGVYQTFKVSDLTWVRDESIEDNDIWVHSVACLECADTGWVKDDGELPSLSTNGPLPEHARAWSPSVPCPKCRPGGVTTLEV